MTVTVANEGVPIPLNKISMIFDPLKRLGAKGDVASAGSNPGLGLYITKEVVVAHGGSIEVISFEADGTIFTARFPRPVPDPTMHGAMTV